MRFRPLERTFADLMAAEGAPLGAAVCVYVEGQRVVDLWHGWRDRARTEPWNGDTLTPAMSTTKGVAALVIHMLAERGLLDLDAPVARYWPEFGANGKRGVLIRHVLVHRAGLSALPDPVRSLGAEPADWVRELERAPLRHPPDERCEYHMISQGYILGELCRRVAGRPLPALLREWVTEPLGADFFVGLRDDEEARVAEMLLAPTTDLVPLAKRAEPGQLLFPIRQLDVPFESAAFRRGEILSSNGIGSARGVARIFAALAEGGTLDGVKLLSKEGVARAGAEASDAIETLSQTRWRLSLGFHKSTDTFYLGPSAEAFGAPGFGGAVGMADPGRRVSFAFLQSEPPASPGVRRAAALLDALYRCLA